MPEELTLHAREEGVYVITAAFTNEDGDPVTPTAITWTLSDMDGNVMNGRENVNIASPAASVDILLSGDDLACETGESIVAQRVFTIHWTYTSALGAGLSDHDIAYFTIDEFQKVPPAA